MPTDYCANPDRWPQGCIDKAKDTDWKQIIADAEKFVLNRNELKMLNPDLLVQLPSLDFSIATPCSHQMSFTLRSQLLILLLATMVQGQMVTKTDISYYPSADLETATDYQKLQCKLDIRYPENSPGFATVIWFHGGGLTSGKRAFLDLKESDIAMVTVSYRLSPQGKMPDFLEDAASATAWTLRNIASYGGDPEKVFISGYSAGGYLAAMVGMDPQWLARYELTPGDLAGIIPVSAQVTTHFRVKKLMGDTRPPLLPVINEFAPFYHVSKTLPPICIFTGDRTVEYPSRVEENEFFVVTLKNLGHPMVEFHEMSGVNHAQVGKRSAPHLTKFIKQVSEVQE